MSSKNGPLRVGVGGPVGSGKTTLTEKLCKAEKIPRKGGPAITRSDLLIINKTDLAPHVGADLAVMESDARGQRGGRPFVMTDLSRLKGLDEVIAFITRQGGLTS